MAFQVTSAQVSELRVALAVVDQVHGYDSQGLRRALRQRHWGRGRPPTLHMASGDRWIVERTHAWLDHWHRLVQRWERQVANFVAFTTIACCMICLQHISG